MYATCTELAPASRIIIPSYLYCLQVGPKVIRSFVISSLCVIGLVDVVAC